MGWWGGPEQVEFWKHLKLKLILCPGGSEVGSERPQLGSES